jgi:hypothetical protein
MKALLSILIGLVVLHSAASLLAYHLFVSKSDFPPGTQVNHIPAGMEPDATSVVLIQSRRAIPAPVIFYIASGYIGIVIAASYGAFRLFTKN